jgi:hypothetical protein
MQPYAAQWSYESRLVCVREENDFDDVPTRDVVWTHGTYFQRFDFFNSKLRPRWPSQEHACAAAGLDQSWDAHREVDILSLYLCKAHEHNRYPFNMRTDLNGVAPNTVCVDPAATWRVIRLCKELSFVLGWRDAWKTRADEAALAQADVSTSAAVSSSGFDGSSQQLGDALDEEEEEEEQDGFGRDEEDEDDSNAPPAFFNSPVLINAADGAAEFVVTMQSFRFTCAALAFPHMNRVLKRHLVVQQRATVEEADRHVTESVLSPKRAVCVICLVVTALDGGRSMPMFAGFCATLCDKQRVGMCDLGGGTKMYLGASFSVSFCSVHLSFSLSSSTDFPSHLSLPPCSTA